MAILTIQLSDEYDKLRQLAEIEGITINQLMEEISTVALAEFSAYTRFKEMADKGDRAEGLRLLEKLDELSS